MSILCCPQEEPSKKLHIFTKKIVVKKMSELSCGLFLDKKNGSQIVGGFAPSCQNICLVLNFVVVNFSLMKSLKTSHKLLQNMEVQ